MRSPRAAPSPALLHEPLPRLDEPITSIAIGTAIAIAAGLACWQPLARGWSQDDDAA